ncbi:MAG: hypothetical protein IPL26_16845 [Leptospiraceae bacterium]|nr:hypothetical protein [Leptospiraceae bacterium]
MKNVIVYKLLLLTLLKSSVLLAEPVSNSHFVISIGLKYGGITTSLNCSSDNNKSENSLELQHTLKVAKDFYDIIYGEMEADKQKQLKIINDQLTSNVRKEIESTLDKYKDMVESDSVLILFFTGHGKEGSLILPNLEKKEGIEEYKITDLMTKIRGSNFKNYLLIVDACRTCSKGNLLTQEDLKKNNFMSSQPDLELIIFSAGPSEQANDGIFGNVLLKNLKDIISNKGELDVNELYQRILKDKTKKETDKSQEDVTKDNVTKIAEEIIESYKMYDGGKEINANATSERKIVFKKKSNIQCLMFMPYFQQNADKRPLPSLASLGLFLYAVNLANQSRLDFNHTKSNFHQIENLYILHSLAYPEFDGVDAAFYANGIRFYNQSEKERVQVPIYGILFFLIWEGFNVLDNYTKSWGKVALLNQSGYPKLSFTTRKFYEPLAKGGQDNDYQIRYSWSF